MTYLMKPADVANAIGAKYEGNAPALDNAKFIAMLKGAHRRIENACNIKSLSRMLTTDVFNINAARNTQPVCLRLSNGFVDKSTIVITAPVGSGYAVETPRVDERMGLLYLFNPPSGEFEITYESGFTVEDGVMVLGTEDWLESALLAHAVLWFRTIAMAPRLPENVSLSQVMYPLYRALNSDVYQRYQRPRYGVQFPVFTPSTQPVVVDTPEV